MQQYDTLARNVIYWYLQTLLVPKLTANRFQNFKGNFTFIANIR